MVSVRQTDVPSWKIGICSVNTLSLLENSRKRFSWKKRTDNFENSLGGCFCREVKQNLLSNVPTADSPLTIGHVFFLLVIFIPHRLGNVVRRLEGFT